MMKKNEKVFLQFSSKENYLSHPTKPFHPINNKQQKQNKMTAVVMSPTTSKFGSVSFNSAHLHSSSHYQHPFRDRTQELHSIFDMYRKSASTTPNSASAIAEAVRNEQKQNGGVGAAATTRKSNVQQQSQEVRQFNDAASRFSLDLSGLAETVANLTRLTQGHGGVSGNDAFDQNSQEIARITQLVKTRLGGLHDDLNDLADLKEAASSSSNAMSKHNSAVLAALRSKLVGTGNNFRDVMQRRTQIMKDAAIRRAKLMADRSPAFAASASGDNNNNNDDHNENGRLLGGDHATSTALMQQNRNTNYLRDRQQAVHEIELAVREVGEIVQDFTRLVYEQDETIIRIDNYVEDALENVNAGSGELMRYLASLNSQRGMILKILGVLFCFLLFFGFFVVR